MYERTLAALDEIASPDDGRASDAIYLVAVFGRATTQAMLNIRTYDRDHFNEWWKPKEAFLYSDPLLRFFNSLRNAFLKEGGVRHEGSALAGRRSITSEGPWTWHLMDPTFTLPESHKGGALGPEASLNELAALYVGWLYEMLDAVHAEFLDFPLSPSQRSGLLPRDPLAPRQGDLN
jgi:hypothetical protein